MCPKVCSVWYSLKFLEDICRLKNILVSLLLSKAWIKKNIYFPVCSFDLYILKLKIKTNIGLNLQMILDIGQVQK